MPIFDHCSGYMNEFVLDVVQGNLFLLSSCNKPCVLRANALVKVDGSQCSLCKHSLDLPVGHVVHMWICMHAGSGILAERGYAIVARYLP